MSNTLILDQNYQNVGLDTMTYTVPTTGSYNVKVQLFDVPPSGISILVKNNGSTIFTAPVIGQSQSALQFKYSFLATATDVITVVLASSAASDQPINSTQSIISIGTGL